MEIFLQDKAATDTFGKHLGSILHGGEVLELVGDIGAGKTALTKAIAVGMGVSEEVQSPTFTLSRVYEAPHNLWLAHYDFYRLDEAGILTAELDESVHDPHIVTVIEWAGIVQGVLPADRVTVHITPQTEASRRMTLHAGGLTSRRVLRELSK